jgi:dGTPase
MKEGNAQMKYDYLSKLSVSRERQTSFRRIETMDEFYSDRSRIVYCSSFRRLQQKAQVFSLEPNASVRTRLTHSLEVSDIGRTLANRISHQLYDKDFISLKAVPYIVAIVENACLLHDIGNPPFGHFGETAIRDWAKKNLTKLTPFKIEQSRLEDYNSLMSDFYEFDGNPQGFRTITKLHTEVDKYGLNLTYATLLCGLKYSRATGEKVKNRFFKKAGYFQSEKDLVSKITKSVGIAEYCRYPFSYIMEAADDIAYCMSDISDGIEKKIITEQIFIKAFKEKWYKNYSPECIPVDLPDIDRLKGFNRDISVPWSRKAIEEAEKSFFFNHENIYNGTANELISKNSYIGRVLETMKEVSRTLLYTSIQAESIELTGYAVITGILKRYERLLNLRYKCFKELIDKGRIENDEINGEIARRLLNLLGNRCLNAYHYSINEINTDEPDFEIKEWWLRVHLIIDHISGMTDAFALETYQMLEGITLMR